MAVITIVSADDARATPFSIASPIVANPSGGGSRGPRLNRSPISIDALTSQPSEGTTVTASPHSANRSAAGTRFFMRVALAESADPGGSSWSEIGSATANHEARHITSASVPRAQT